MVTECENSCGSPAQHGIRMTEPKGDSAVFCLCRTCTVQTKRAFKDWDVTLELMTLSAAQKEA